MRGTCLCRMSGWGLGGGVYVSTSGVMTGRARGGGGWVPGVGVRGEGYVSLSGVGVGVGWRGIRVYIGCHDWKRYMYLHRLPGLGRVRNCLTSARYHTSPSPQRPKTNRQICHRFIVKIVRFSPCKRHNNRHEIGHIVLCCLSKTKNHRRMSLTNIHSWSMTVCLLHW